MLRETQFLVGGAVVLGAGLAFAGLLVWSAAGVAYFGSWIGALLAIGFGTFFVHVGRDEGRARRRFLAEEGTDPGRAPESGRESR